MTWRGDYCGKCRAVAEADFSVYSTYNYTEPAAEAGEVSEVRPGIGRTFQPPTRGRP